MTQQPLNDTNYRLEELKADFDAERTKAIDWVKRTDVLLNPMSAKNYDYLTERTVERWASGTWSTGPEITHVARRYIIARDFNVYDDSWEMLWKLRDGGSL